jgi:hypothetical protein
MGCIWATPEAQLHVFPDLDGRDVSISAAAPVTSVPGSCARLVDR